MKDAHLLKFLFFISMILGVYYLVDRYDILVGENIRNLQDSISTLGAFSPIGFILLYTIGTMLFLPGTIFTLIGGAVFGVFWGSILGIIGATTGALAAHVIARLFGKDVVDKFLHNRFTRVIAYNKQIKEKGFLTVLILRLTPFIPYNILNLALAYSPVRIKEYAYATAIGIAPSVIAYVYLGEAVASLSTANVSFAIIGVIGYMILTALLVSRMSRYTGDNDK